MLDPCDLCPLFPQGHDVPPFPPSCLECPFLRGDLAFQPQANVGYRTAAELFEEQLSLLRQRNAAPL